MKVNCRIGSLERRMEGGNKRTGVNCRIGSLESLHGLTRATLKVNCRIGSLEKPDSRYTRHGKRKLPNRQFRKGIFGDFINAKRKLPNRQFRKDVS